MDPKNNMKLDALAERMMKRRKPMMEKDEKKMKPMEGRC